jgi:type IV pilus assembly protein PilW
MPTSMRARGFTLLELLVGAAVGAVVLVGISLTFISQAQQYQAHASRRGIQANARQAMAFLERTLRVAGYGVDADRAIIAYDSYNAVTDRQDPGYPDAFIVHWRDPLFRRQVLAIDSSTITIDNKLIEPMRQGQILMVICSPNPTPTNTTEFMANANPPHAFVTVATYTAKDATAISLDATPPAGAPNSPLLGPGRLFHEQANFGAGPPCFHDVAHPPQLVMVHRAAFYVAMFDDDGDPATPERTPYLMMHEGLDMPTATNPTGDGNIDANDAVPVAEGIEQLQAAYILDTNDDDADQTPLVLGVNPTPAMDITHYGENWEQIDPSLPTGWFFNPFNPYPKKLYTPQDMALAHLKDHPANIRQVRLTLVARSQVPDPQIPGDNLLTHPDGTPYPDGPDLGGSILAWRHLENLTLGPLAPEFKPSGGHFYRTILRQSVAPKNMLMNRQFIPVNPQGGG